MKKKEILLFGTILIICLAILAGRQIKTAYTDSKAGHIRITARGKEFGTYSLAKDQTISIMDTNLCKIENGTCTMIAATCPAEDGSACIYQDSITARNRGIIACLPNNVVIEFVE